MTHLIFCLYVRLKTKNDPIKFQTEICFGIEVIKVYIPKLLKWAVTFASLNFPEKILYNFVLVTAWESFEYFTKIIQKLFQSCYICIFMNTFSQWRETM